MCGHLYKYAWGMEMERLLALGSVVKVQVEEQATARLMIAGYLPEDRKTGKIYDYVTVLYPWGMQQVPAVQMILQDQILEVEAEGYLDEKAAAFTRELPELIGKIAGEARRLILDAAAEEKQEESQEAAEEARAKSQEETEEAQEKGREAAAAQEAQGTEAALQSSAVVQGHADALEEFG